jgi:archaemetzincin
MRIALLPIGTVNEDVLKKIQTELKEIFPESDCSIFGEGMALPADAYNRKRQQYYSTRILGEINKYVRRIRADRILGVTEVDLYVPQLNFVFGEATCPGKTAIISLFRLRPEFYGQPANQKLFVDRSVKEAVHEIGHTLGLKHCQNPRCVMFFSNSILDTDHKGKTFCEKCYFKVLRSRG